MEQFLLYSPLNQGLKPILLPFAALPRTGFYSTVH